MENYRKSSHCMYDIKYHLVWNTKYRKAVITGEIALRTRELIRIVCLSVRENIELALKIENIKWDNKKILDN